PIISADFSTDTSIGCEPFNVIFNNNSQNSSFYNWDFGDGNTASFFNGFYEYQSEGNYIIKLVVEDINGCKDSTFEPINVYPSPTSSYTYIASDPCYLPISVDFTNTSLLSNNFEWNFGNGQTSSINNPSIIFDSVGNYNIQLISGNSYNCYDTLNNFFDVVNKQVPIANFNFNDSICLRDTTFFNSTTLFADSLVWNLGNGIITYGDAISYVYDSSGQYTITLFAFNTGSGCSDTLQSSNSLDVLSSPVADFNFNQIQSNEPLSGSLEFINNSTAADFYFWDFSNIDSTSEEYPTYYYSYDSDGTYYYTLYAFNNYGCVDSLTKDLYVFYKKTLFIPNALYPSSNKFEVANFIPKGTGMKKYKIEIFDLYGNLIWESSSLDDEGQPTEYWDGKFNGQDVETDIYIWKVEAQFKDDSFWEGQKPIEEKILRKTGSLTVIR
ncbi:MAG: PKD domain-containing protein, partial [Flavobacteriales bacterium]|nr:PKD domain-containing protein [Flavobacteriales bacterium]